MTWHDFWLPLGCVAEARTVPKKGDLRQTHDLSEPMPRLRPLLAPGEGHLIASDAIFALCYMARFL